MIIEINGEKYPCTVTTCMSQMGQQVVRVTSDEAPVAEDGFMLYTDDESMTFDRSGYKYLYREDGTIKEYIQDPEEILPIEGFALGVPDGPLDRIRRRMSQIAGAVNANAANITELDDALCEYSADMDERVGEVEDALCELSEDEEVDA